MKVKNELPAYLDEIIRKSGIRRLKAMERFHVHLLSECLKSHGVACRALYRACYVSDKCAFLPFYVLQIEGSVFDLRGAKGWDNIVRSRLLRATVKDALSFSPQWESDPHEYQSTLWGQGATELRRAIDEGMTKFNAQTLQASTPEAPERPSSRPRI